MEYPLPSHSTHSRLLRFCDQRIGIATGDSLCQSNSREDHYHHCLSLSSLSILSVTLIVCVCLQYLARRAYSEWPEKRFCNDTSSFFKCHYWAHMGGRTIGRMIRNDADLVQGLKALETEKPGGRDVRITDVDFNKLNFENQLKIDLKTDILVSHPLPLPTPPHTSYDRLVLMAQG
jgi:hypothetical protein